MTLDELAREARAAYWTSLGKPKRAAKEASAESHEAWRRTVAAVIVRHSAAGRHAHREE